MSQSPNGITAEGGPMIPTHMTPASTAAASRPVAPSPARDGPTQHSPGQHLAAGSAFATRRAIEQCGDVISLRMTYTSQHEHDSPRRLRPSVGTHGTAERAAYHASV